MFFLKEVIDEPSDVDVEGAQTYSDGVNSDEKHLRDAVVNE